jgi:hypothetical protein
MTSGLVVPSASPQGVQEARIAWYPPYASTSGAEAIELARVAGIELDPWQQVELTHGLGESADWKCPKCTYRVAERVACPDHPGRDLVHPWAAFEVAEIVPRQNGKSELLIARMLAGLFLLEEELQIYSAHLFDTAMEIFRRLVFVVENCDELRRAVKSRGSKLAGITYSHGQEGIELRDGRRIRFKARTGGGGRGFSGDTLYLDEAMILREMFLGATIPILSARANPQIWLAGSPPDEDDPTHDGVVLAKRRKRALAGGDRSLAYFEHSADGEDPGTVSGDVLDDPEQWALANPGLGIRITTEYVANERRAMGDRQFAVERLGIGAWPDVSEDAGRLIAKDTWIALADPGSGIASNRAFSVDIEPGQAWATISAAGERDDGLHHIGVVEHARNTGWVLDSAKEWHGRVPDAQWMADPRADWGNLLIELEEAGIPVVRLSPGDYKDACGGFFQMVVQKQLRYRPPQPELDTAVAGARTKPLLDAWKWARESGVTITPLVSCTNALWGSRNAEGAYTTVLYGSDETPSEPEAVGARAPVVLTQEDVTTCFACSQGSCSIHDRGGFDARTDHHGTPPH